LYDVYPPGNNVNDKVFFKSDCCVKEILELTTFNVCFLKRYFSLFHYDKTTYPKLLSTYPKIGNIDLQRREAFLKEVADVVSKLKEISVPVMTTLIIARKKRRISNLLSSFSVTK